MTDGLVLDGYYGLYVSNAAFMAVEGARSSRDGISYDGKGGRFKGRCYFIFKISSPKKTFHPGGMCC